MLKVIFTLDYEIHGNGEGSPADLLIEPTDRMLKFFDEYGAKLTIMADIAEILKFKEYRDKNGSDDYCYDTVAEQLKRAVKTGHDVQLHIHSSYFNAVYNNQSWQQDYSEYDLARLGYKRLNEVIKIGKNYLESLIKPVKSSYKCSAFRAANWSMHPSADIVKALINNGIKIDTSVFKYGFRNKLVNFDYTNAFNDLVPWPASSNDICKMDPKGKLIEIPIYCEKRSIWSFLSINRIYRVITGLKHRLGKNSKEDSLQDKSENRSKGPSLISKLFSKFSMIYKRHAWKMDFNQCTGNQLIKGLKRAETKYKNIPFDLPIVLIGHSKIFTKANQNSLKSFLKYVKNNSDRFTFGTFHDIDLEKIQKKYK